MLYYYLYLLVSCHGVRYARIFSGYNLLQISQLAVYNSSGVNVALKKTTSASPVLTGYKCKFYASGAVDGVLMAKDALDCSYKFYSSARTGNSWTVDLGSEHTITKVVYYNRLYNNYGRAVTYTLTLLNAASSVVCSCHTFTSALVQDLSLIPGMLFIF